MRVASNERIWLRLSDDLEELKDQAFARYGYTFTPFSIFQVDPERIIFSRSPSLYTVTPDALRNPFLIPTQRADGHDGFTESQRKVLVEAQISTFIPSAYFPHIPMREIPTDIFVAIHADSAPFKPVSSAKREKAHSTLLRLARRAFGKDDDFDENLIRPRIAHVRHDISVSKLQTDSRLSKVDFYSVNPHLGRFDPPVGTPINLGPRLIGRDVAETEGFRIRIPEIPLPTPHIYEEYPSGHEQNVTVTNNLFLHLSPLYGPFADPVEVEHDVSLEGTPRRVFFFFEPDERDPIPYRKSERHNRRFSLALRPNIPSVTGSKPRHNGPQHNPRWRSYLDTRFGSFPDPTTPERRRSWLP
jgi:hypothetical protein